ncbi:MAG: TIR domain-containing protein [Acidimicrobiia bacterium]
MSTFEQQRRRLLEAVSKAELSYVLAKQAALRQGRTAPVRHKCFISYHGADIVGVTDFVEKFNDVFIPRVLGASDSDHFKDPVSSEDEEYIKQQIGSRYLSDSTVTILYVGQCTWARKYVDWELSSSLRNDPVNKRNGLLALTPADRSTHPLPGRFADNWTKDGSCYARYQYYPRSADELRGWIEDAFKARDSRSNLINNKRALRKINSACP